MRNRLGIAMGKRVYKAYRELLASPRWKKLAAGGRAAAAAALGQHRHEGSRRRRHPVRGSAGGTGHHQHAARENPARVRRPRPCERCVAHGRRRRRTGAGRVRARRRQRGATGRAAAERRHAGIREKLAGSAEMSRRQRSGDPTGTEPLDDINAGNQPARGQTRAATPAGGSAAADHGVLHARAGSFDRRAARGVRHLGPSRLVVRSEFQRSARSRDDAGHLHLPQTTGHQRAAVPRASTRMRCPRRRSRARSKCWRPMAST